MGKCLRARSTRGFFSRQHPKPKSVRPPEHNKDCCAHEPDQIELAFSLRSDAVCRWSPARQAAGLRTAGAQEVRLRNAAGAVGPTLTGAG